MFGSAREDDRDPTVSGLSTAAKSTRLSLVRGLYSEARCRLRIQLAILQISHICCMLPYGLYRKCVF